MTYRFQTIEQLSLHVEAFDYMRRAFQLGLDEGAWESRGAPDGGERCAIAIAETGEIVAGATYFQIGNGRGWIDLVYVDAAHRKRGLGRRLIEVAKADFFEDGVDLVEFGTFLKNQPMQELGREAGFTTIGVIMQVRR